LLKLREVASINWAKTLAGACAVASVLVFRRLRALGFPAVLVLNQNDTHCFVMVERLVIDPTATQFLVDGPEVVLGTHRELARRYSSDVRDVWQVGVVFEEEGQLNSALESWDDDQQPSYLAELGFG
jgi:hypothetical protein